MSFSEWVGQLASQGIHFRTYWQAEEAFKAANVCRHNSTIGGVCDACGHVLEIAFAVSLDKSRYLHAAKAVR